MEHAEHSPKWKTRVVRDSFPDRDFDEEFWQEQGPEAIFDAAFELVMTAEEVKNGRRPSLQGSVTRVKRVRR